MGRTRLEGVESGGVYGLGICYSGSSGVDEHMAIHAMRYDMIGCTAILKSGSWKRAFGVRTCQLQAIMLSLGTYTGLGGDRHQLSK
jgi:hypothetical protein